MGCYKNTDFRTHMEEFHPRVCSNNLRGDASFAAIGIIVNRRAKKCGEISNMRGNIQAITAWPFEARSHVEGISEPLGQQLPFEQCFEPHTCVYTIPYEIQITVRGIFSFSFSFP